MRHINFGRALLCTASTAAVLVPAGMAAAACPTGPLPPCNPPAFTGGAGARSADCVRSLPPECRDRSDARGQRGNTGKRGRTGERGVRGSRGRTGETGARGRTGSDGATGSTGPQGLPGTQGAAGSQGIQGSAGATGAQGTAGATGAQGADGAQGIQGDAGATGAQGEIGATGSVGPQGLPGIQGDAGETGPQGDAGVAGDAGADGDTGPEGPAGPAGETGATGADGAPGAATGLSQYGYIYNLAAQTVAIEADVTFSDNGVLSPGITHAPGTTDLQVTTAGTYKVAFSTSGTETSQFALFVNGVQVPGTVYASGAGTQQNNGQVIVVLGAGDTLTLRNHSSSAAVGLATPIGGTQASVNASILIEKLAG